MWISRFAVEIVLLDDSWCAGRSGLLELVTGVYSDFDAMMTKIVGKQVDIVLL